MKREKFMSRDQQLLALEDGSLKWIRIVATLSSVIGTLTLIGIMSHSAWAQQPQGFQGGARTFGNPFAGQGGAGAPPPAPAPQGDENFGDDFDDGAYDDGSFGGNPGDMGGGGGAPGGPSAPQANNGISVGGGPPSGVVANNTTPALPIDSMTAEGSKATVTDFNFPDADIMDIAKTLGKLTGKNFILDKDVKGRITIISNAPITVGDAWKAFLTALDINGFAIIPSGKYLRIARQRDARDKQLKTYSGDYAPDTDALITRVFPLKYLSAEEVARNFRSFMPANSRIIPYEQTNTVIVTDTGSNISKLGRLLEILDVEGYDAGIEVIPVKFASAVELSKLIDTLVPGSNVGGPGGGGAGAPRFGGGGRFTARRTKEGGIINTIIADERTNTLIVHANNRGADQIRELVAKLDQKLPSTAAGGRVHVIYLQFADSEQISTTLNGLVQQAATGGRPAGATGTGVNPIQQSIFEGNIRVAADKATNSLVVTASPNDFVTVQRVVNRLDIPRDQVYAEVVIMEIQLNRNFEFSSNVISPINGLGALTNTDLLNFITNPISQKGALLGFKTGKTTNLKIGGADVPVSSVQGLIKAIQSKTNGNIIATPQILALDNTEAIFSTKEKIPVPTTTAVQGAGVATGITKEDVALEIKIKPQINKVANFIKMDIEAKLADFSGRELPQQVAQLAIATNERYAKTSVVVGDQDTVVMGGLVRDSATDTVAKVPLLGDIPLLGWLFRSKKTDSFKTNMLIFITPQIIRQYETVRTILDKKLKERDEFIESTAGGEDPQRRYRDNMIRNLPNIKDVASQVPQRSFAIDDVTNDVQPNEIRQGDSLPSPNSGAKSAPQGQGATPGYPAPQNGAALGDPNAQPYGGAPQPAPGYQGDPLAPQPYDGGLGTPQGGYPESAPVPPPPMPMDGNSY